MGIRPLTSSKTHISNQDQQEMFNNTNTAVSGTTWIINLNLYNLFFAIFTNWKIVPQGGALNDFGQTISTTESKEQKNNTISSYPGALGKYLNSTKPLTSFISFHTQHDRVLTFILSVNSAPSRWSISCWIILAIKPEPSIIFFPPSASKPMIKYN